MVSHPLPADLLAGISNDLPGPTSCDTLLPSQPRIVLISDDRATPGLVPVPIDGPRYPAQFSVHALDDNDFLNTMRYHRARYQRFSTRIFSPLGKFTENFTQCTQKPSGDQRWAGISKNQNLHSPKCNTIISTQKNTKLFFDLHSSPHKPQCSRITPLQYIH